MLGEILLQARAPTMKARLPTESREDEDTCRRSRALQATEDPAFETALKRRIGHLGRTSKMEESST